MVGAFELGDFCWHIEDMLNALLDARIDAFADSAMTVRVAHAALPAMKQRLMGQSTGLQPEAINAIGAHAEALAEGGQAGWDALRSHLPGYLAGLLPSGEDSADTTGDLRVTDDVHASVCEELRKNLQTVETLLEAASANRKSVAGEEHVRALHTMAGVLALEPEGEDVAIARTLERVLEAQRRTGAQFDNEGIWALGSCLAYLQARLERLEGDQETSLPDNGASLVLQLKSLEERFQQSAPVAPEPMPSEPPPVEPEPSTSDEIQPPEPAPEPKAAASPMDEITRIFLEEAHDVLGRFDSLLNTWRDNIGAMPLVQNLQREIHTFKGGARMAGLEALGGLSHAMEDLLERTVRHEIPPAVSTVQLLEEGCDQLLDWIEQVARGTRPDGSPELQSFLQRIETHSREVVEMAAAAAELPPSEPKVFTDLPESDDKAADKGEEVPGQKQIRVDTELLDSLIKAAGEVNIFRARVERHIAAVRGNLAEFNETVGRLREQFRKLEIETEAQIHSRIPDMSHGDDTEFDPLELDRFSTMQQLSRSLSESVTDLLNLEDLLEDSARHADTLLNQQSRVSTELQEGLMQTLMVPFGSIAPRLRRVVRKAAIETGKKARLKLLMAGSSDQLDRNVLDHITVPLEHMLRNAVAHGIEEPDQRHELGKEPEGEINVRVEAEATEFVIRVEDDGAGINRAAIRQRAIEQGLIDESSDPPPQQLFELILGSGFSTSTTVTRLAGRGVGMDVVNSEVKQIGGSLEIESEEGAGTCFTIRIPFTLAVLQAIGVLVGGQRYMVPLTNVAGVARVPPDDYRAMLQEEEPAHTFAGQSYPVLELEPLLGEPAQPLSADSVSLLMIEAGDHRAALRVTDLLGHREVVIKPVGPQITSVPGILGGTVTGDGRVVVILDPGPIIRQALLHGVRPVLTERAAVPRERRKVGMVVDDSITMRRINSRVLESQDLEPIIARDGQEAVEKMQNRVPDILLLDIEMPRMDGYQLAEYVRGDARLRHIPIVMITSRSGEKHRERARRAGADAYLTKPYKEAELIGTIQSLLGSGEE
jgi:chemosensory pili system protein ChpA (sensor histidine kinase/response regulator)